MHDGWVTLHTVYQDPWNVYHIIQNQHEDTGYNFLAMSLLGGEEEPKAGDW